MSDILSIGASGVRAYQTALTTISENIANAGTAGYSRRTATISEVAAPATATSAANGMGATVSGIARAGDDLKSAQVRSTGADLARTDASATWLDRIQSALTGDQLGTRLTDFFDSASAVAADPSALAPRATMLELAASVATAFSGTGEALAAAASDLDATADAGVSQLNSLAASLAKVNSALGRATPGTSGSAAMLDERDRLLELMSALTDVSVSLDGAGRATVRAGGEGGPVLVQGDVAGTVTYVRSGGAVSLAVHRDGDTQALLPNGGALAGLAEGAQRIADAQTSLDSLATDFTNGVNAVQANGRDLTGNPGTPMFATGASPTQVTVALSDPRGIAAAAVGGGTRDNRNLAVLSALRTSGGFEGQVTDLVSVNAATLSARQTVGQAQTAIRNSAVAARNSASGVNIDEEAVDLMRFQQAYSASSRMIQTARDTLQTILDIN